MQQKNLHIVSFTVPFPADYGGVYDVFYKLEALQKSGTKIHLHCFKYQRAEQSELNKYCVEVIYYNRVKSFSFLLPYIVSSRISQQLYRNLLKDDFPILLEGVHCSYPLMDKRFSDRKILLRIFNAEFIYYKNLVKYSKNIFQKIFFYNESRLLKAYESKLTKINSSIISLSRLDEKIYREQLHATNVQYIPLFIPWKISAKAGKGNFCLYHGDLSVLENENVAKWLLQNVFNKINLPFIIAGKYPTENLQRFIKKHYKNVQLITNPAEEKMQSLINDAQINILLSFNSTGIKLKLVNALFNGRHCIVNEAIIENTNFSKLCHVCVSAEDMQMKIKELFNESFSEEEIEERRNILSNHFDNDANAKKIIKLIWS